MYHFIIIIAILINFYYTLAQNLNIDILVIVHVNNINHTYLYFIANDNNFQSSNISNTSNTSNIALLF